MTVLRVASFNVLHGRSLDGAMDPARFRAAIEALDADVLALQEVDRGQPRSDGRDLTAEAAAAMGAVDQRFVPTVSGTPGEQWRPFTAGDDGAVYGIALLSRRPVARWRTLVLPPARMRAPVLVPGPGRLPGVLLLRDEPRVAVTAELDELTVVATHLSFVPGWNRRQLGVLTDALGPRPPDRSRVLLGDLNLPGRWAAAHGWRRLVEAPTWPAGRPRVQFDHVLAQGDVSATSSGTRELAVSDHRAVEATLTGSARSPGVLDPHG